MPLALPPEEIAAALSNRHLNAQRGSEGLVIVRAIAAGQAGVKRGYQNHPAAVMWRGHLRALCEYQIEMCDEWLRRGFSDGCRAEYERWWSAEPAPTRAPPWWGLAPLHGQQASSLARRFSDHYGERFAVTANDDPFLWPPDPTAPDFAERLAAQMRTFMER